MAEWKNILNEDAAKTKSHLMGLTEVMEEEYHRISSYHSSGHGGCKQAAESFPYKHCLSSI